MASQGPLGCTLSYSPPSHATPLPPYLYMVITFYGIGVPDVLKCDVFFDFRS